jgi:hypothetical protein
MMGDFERARDAMCDLNAACAIIAICEGGIFRTAKGNAFADHIASLCKQHAEKQLVDHDRNHP